MEGRLVAQFLERWAESTWMMVVDSAFLFMVGLTLAGLLSLALNERVLARLAKGSPLASVFKAALIGLPLPLCSCSVLPVASQLRRSGVRKGGVMAFLVSTPESGVDSIILTYALMDPVMTVARPVAAWLTALSTGLLEEMGFPEKRARLPIQPPAIVETCCPDGSDCQPASAPPKTGLFGRVYAGVRYAFQTLMDDLAPYLVIGFILAGLVGAIIGSSLSIPAAALSGWHAYAWSIIVGVPLYVCATSSTPLAAALLAAGFSPGAILTFLLVGPATNVTSMVVLKKILGAGSLVRFLLSVIVVAVLCGLALDAIYRAVGHPVSIRSRPGGESASWLDLASALALCLLIGYYSARKLIRRVRARI